MTEAEAKKWLKMVFKELETIEQHLKVIRGEVLKVAVLLSEGEDEKEDKGVDYTKRHKDDRWPYGGME